MTEEKREYRRFPAAAVVEIRLEGQSGDAAEPAESLNVSSGGLLLSANEKLPIGDRVALRLDLDSAGELVKGSEPHGLPAGGRIIEASGRVVRVKGAPEIGFEIAIAFENINPGDAEALDMILRKD